MNIEQFISKLESSDAYRNNGEVRKLVEDSRQILIDLAHGDDGDAFKAELMKFNSRLDWALDPKAASEARKAELVEKMGLEKQYPERINTLKIYSFLPGLMEGASKSGAPVPTYEEVIKTFTTEMLEIADTFQEPTLLLMPETSLAEKVFCIDNQKTIDDQRDTYVSEIFPKTDEGGAVTAGWRAVIVDGAKEMEMKLWDSGTLELENRLDNRRVTRKPGEKGMDRNAYAMLMMESIKNGGRPIDKDSFTLLDDDPALSDTRMPDGRWNHVMQGVVFSSSPLDTEEPNARFRSSVGGDVVLNAMEVSETSETIEKFNLAEQYIKRLQTLDTFDFFDSETHDSFVIKGIDGKKYPVPNIDEIRARLTPKKLKLIEKRIKNPMLLIVPFAMPLKTIAEKVGSKKGALPKQNSVVADDEWDVESDLPDRGKDKDGKDKEQLVYFPEKYNKVDPGGFSKSEILEAEGSLNSFPGWQVVVVEGASRVPKNTLGKSAIKLKSEFDGAGLSGLTTEDWLMLHAEGVRIGVPFDDCKKNSVDLLLASYLKKYGGTPSAYWNSENESLRAELFVGFSDEAIDNTGARRAVRL